LECQSPLLLLLLLLLGAAGVQVGTLLAQAAHTQPAAAAAAAAVSGQQGQVGAEPPQQQYLSLQASQHIVDDQARLMATGTLRLLCYTAASVCKQLLLPGVTVRLCRVPAHAPKAR
jgi:hypothetical protein